MLYGAAVIRSERRQLRLLHRCRRRRRRPRPSVRRVVRRDDRSVPGADDDDHDTSGADRPPLRRRPRRHRRTGTHGLRWRHGVGGGAGGSAFPTAPTCLVAGVVRGWVRLRRVRRVVGDDTLSVRVTELPAAYEWSPAGGAAAEAERSGGTVVDSKSSRSVVRRERGSPWPTPRATRRATPPRCSSCAPAGSCTASPTPMAASRRPQPRPSSSTRSTCAERYTRSPAGVAQSAEHFTRNEKVRGSIPRSGSKFAQALEDRLR